jgi:hypothetical protein
LIGSLSLPAAAADLRIDIPVALKEAKIVLNMDHLVFEGTTPTGLNYMTRLSANLVENHAKWQMTAIFHGPAGYMLLDDAAYDRVKQSTAGNPYKQMIAQRRAPTAGSTPTCCPTWRSTAEPSRASSSSCRTGSCSCNRRAG